MLKLNKRVALITGGASGIGEAAAKTFAAEGARVAIADLDETRGQSVAAQLQEDFHEAMFVPLDVRDSNSVQSMIAEVMNRWGQLDILVTSAGIGEFGRITEIDEAHWDRVLDINLKGTFLCAKYAIPAMLEGGRGNIITVGSAVGLHPIRHNTAYGPAKAGVVYLTRLLALDYGPEIRANCVCPGCTDTPMMAEDIASTPDPETELASVLGATVAGRMATPEEIAAAMLFLASDESDYITGVALPVDGGRLLKIRSGLERK